MVQSRQLQATHCRREPAWKGQWRDAKGRTWYVEVCRDHAPKLSSPRRRASERAGVTRRR